MPTIHKMALAKIIIQIEIRKKINYFLATTRISCHPRCWQLPTTIESRLLARYKQQKVAYHTA